MVKSLRFLAYFLTISISFGGAKLAIGQNAIDLDGLDDRITSPNASALIANGNFTMACWVYPTNAGATWPDFDGFAGFRNESNCDLYFLQLSPSTMEIRYRNSVGTVYDINYPGLVLNTWNHFVATYDGTKLRFYHNGNPADSINATGVITSTTTPFYMGTIPYSFNNFDLDGRLDDVGLWSRALSGADVNTLFNACSITVSDPTLKLCYQFNQGVGGGTNTGITTAIDSKGNINGNMSGFALTGTTSNFITYGNPTAYTLNDTAACTYTSPSGIYQWTSTGTYYDTLTNSAGCDSIITVNLYIDAGANSTSLSATTCEPYISPSGNYTWTTSGTYMDTLTAASGCDSVITVNLTVNQPSTASITDTACTSYISPSGNYTWTTSGIYTDTLQNIAGCDSVISVNLSVTTVNTSVTLNGSVLTAGASNATYQWLACDNNYALIPTATNASFTPGVDGNYAVAVTYNGCTDTSACTMVVLTALDIHAPDLPVSIHPNPHADQFTIGLPTTYAQISVRILDITGKTIGQFEFSNTQEVKLEIPGPAGLYFVHLEADGYRKSVKVVKESQK